MSVTPPPSPGQGGAEGEPLLPSDPTGLPECQPPTTRELTAGETLELRIGPVAKRLRGAPVRMLAYNGSIPGPTLRVAQGSEVAVRVINEGDTEATVHWHGLRLANLSDGTHETQEPIGVGADFNCRVAFPDPGVYWYHPHIREDYNQEMGLYGNVLVVPSDPDYWPPVNRELLLTLDDVLLEDGKVAPFRSHETTHVAMGRFGDLMLVGGEPEPSFRARQGDVVRLYLTNTANTRVFNVALPGAEMKLVGGDSGRCEREELRDAVLIAPSERAVVDILFPNAGELALEHITPAQTYRLASVVVEPQPAEPSYRAEFEVLHADPELAAERTGLASVLAAPPAKTVALVAEMDMGADADEGPATYACPMHPDVVSDRPERCPRCGMKLLPVSLIDDAVADDHHDHHGAEGHGHPGHAEAPGGIEWEDDMVAVNRMTTPSNTRWKIVDRGSGAANQAIDWRFRVGDRVKIRLINEMDSDHPMPHPFHIHGAGRFLVVARDGVAEPNLVWKDTVLVRTGETVDILLEVTNPGRWMAHCHISEHHESGMWFSFEVVPQPESAS